VSVEERRARLAVRHRLVPSRRTDDVVSIVDDLVALHSSDPVSVYLSATARMAHPSFEPLDAALYEDRTLVRHHAMRRTLWVFSPQAAREAHASSTVGVARIERRRLLEQLDAHPAVSSGAQWLDAARADVLTALAAGRPMSTRELGLAVPALRLPLDVSRRGPTQGAHTRVLLLLGFEGEIVRVRPTGRWINGQYRWTPMGTWLPGGVTGLDPHEAEVALVRRWLRAFGPGTTTDLQWWTGWTLGATRRALAAAGAVEVSLDGGVTGWLDADDLDPVVVEEPWVALLPGLDPTTMGWKQRDWYLDAEHGRRVFDGNGNGGPAVWVDGWIVGGWVQRPDGAVAVGLLERLSARQRRGVDTAARDLEALLGPSRFIVRFPAPLQADLLA
jgi:hypothetical protein